MSGIVVSACPLGRMKKLATLPCRARLVYAVVCIERLLVACVRGSCERSRASARCEVVSGAVLLSASNDRVHRQAKAVRLNDKLHSRVHKSKYSGGHLAWLNYLVKMPIGKLLN